MARRPELVSRSPMAPTIWIDGKYYDEASAKISVFDHGLLYGDGVFEGIRVYNRRIFRLHQHLDRLYASAKAAWIEIPLARDAMDRLLGEVAGESGSAGPARPRRLPPGVGGPRAH